MRRYVTVVIPMMMIWGAYGLACLSRARWRGVRLVTWVVLLAWLVGMLWQSRVIWRQVDYAGTAVALMEFNRRLEPGAILLFDDQNTVGTGDILGTPLRFIFDHSVLVLRNPQATTPEAMRALVRDWQQQGRSVYLVSEMSKEVSFKDALRLTEAQSFSLATSVLKPTYSDYPNQVVPMLYNLKIQAIEPLR
jgi:hypothetical protein